MPLPQLYTRADLFIEQMKLKNTLRYLKSGEQITHLGLVPRGGLTLAVQETVQVS